jgi:UMF1 family MFS transporter
LKNIKDLNNKKVINAWAIFDWANSAYSLVITTAIFPKYFMAVTDPEIHIGSITLTNSSMYAYSISMAYIIIAICSPALSGIADSSGRKKLFLRSFTMVGATACIALFYFKGMGQLYLGAGAFILATIGFAGGLVFYNSYLPEIATEDQYDKVSAKGFAYGYVGSVLLLLINLAIILKPEFFGITTAGLPARIAFVMVGMWWIGFSQITFKYLPKDRKTAIGSNVLTKGFKEIAKVWEELKSHKNIRTFLLAFFCYSAGVQTVLYMASTFADVELKFPASELIALIIILQLVAIGGAYTFAHLSKLRGNKFSLIFMLLVWCLICVAAYAVQAKWQFYLVAVAVGMVMGGIQSLSRSTYSKLLPQDLHDTTSYFSFYDVLEKLAIVLGTFSFGFIENLTGGMRNSVLTLGVFFMLGIAIILKVKIPNRQTKSEFA